MHLGAILGAKMEPRSHEKGIKKVVLKRLENDSKNKKKIAGPSASGVLDPQPLAFKKSRI